MDRQGTPLAKWWYEYLNAEETKNSLGSERMKFYANIVKESEVWNPVFSVSELPLETRSQKIECEHDGRGEQESLDLLRTSCKNFVAFLQNQYNLDNPTACPRVLCILVFDEAQELTIASNYEDRNKYHRLGSILKETVDDPVFTVFLSTNSNIRKLAPPSYLHPSLRQVPDRELSPPLTELPFDVFAKDLNNELCENGRSTLREVSSLDVMVHFGRTM